MIGFQNQLPFLLEIHYQLSHQVWLNVDPHVTQLFEILFGPQNWPHRWGHQWFWCSNFRYYSVALDLRKIVMSLNYKLQLRWFWTVRKIIWSYITCSYIFSVQSLSLANLTLKLMLLHNLQRHRFLPLQYPFGLVFRPLNLFMISNQYFLASTTSH